MKTKKKILSSFEVVFKNDGTSFQVLNKEVIEIEVESEVVVTIDGVRQELLEQMISEQKPILSYPPIQTD